jgi:hypothetical protein
MASFGRIRNSRDLSLMPRPRLPYELAKVLGRDVHDPQRFKNRSTVDPGPLGDPYPDMTERQKEIWRECAEEWWWCRRSDRYQLRMICRSIERSEQLGADFPAQELRMLLKMFNSFGGSPTSSVRRRLALNA